jgi:hypothetical protein
MGLFIRYGMACAVVLGLGGTDWGCSASTAQTETCLARADAAMVAEAKDRCHGYTWRECPVRQEIVDKYAAERHRCP